MQTTNILKITQGSEKVPSGHPGRVDFSLWEVACPIGGQGIRQVAGQLLYIMKRASYDLPRVSKI